MIQNLAAQGKVPLDFSKIPGSISLGSISLTLDIEQIGMATGWYCLGSSRLRSTSPPRHVWRTRFLCRIDYTTMNVILHRVSLG